MEETLIPVEPPDESALPYGADDDQIALKIADEWAEKVAYFRNDWHVYESGCWRRRDIQEVKRNIRRQLRQWRGLLKGGVTQARINALASMLEDDLFKPDSIISQAETDARNYISLKNGRFNLETQKLEPHQAGDWSTIQLDFAYDEDADCPTFRRFLNTSLTDEAGATDFTMIKLLHEALAYSMTARTDLKSSFWLVGKPDSGKSTLISFVRSLMGSFHVTLDLNQLATNRFLLSGIAGKRVVTFTEADTNSFLPDALYKAMVGGQDEIYVDVKNKPGFSFVPTAKFWWAMNGAPRVNDRSGATINRLKLILFDRTIPESERISNLSERLRSERAGVFNSLMDAYLRLRRAEEFTRVKRSEEWLKTYQLENDTEQVYLQQQLELGQDYSVMTGELYDDYRAWCERFGYKPKNQTQIARDWRRLGLVNSEWNGRTRWRGARIRVQHMP